MPVTERTREDVINDYKSITAETYGWDDPNVTNKVEPRIAQARENRIQQTNGFLKKINFHPVKENSADILAFGVPSTLLRRQSGNTHSWGRRRPTDPSHMVQRKYQCHDFQSDPFISWSKIDTWSHLPNFYEAWRDVVDVGRGADRLKVGWNGQFYSPDTDPDKYADLQDYQAGWFQFMIEHAPEQVLGIKPDPDDDFGYSIDPIHIGQKASKENGFKSIDGLVHYMRHNLLHKHFRKKTALRALVGDDLLTKENMELLDRDLEPSEKTALSLWLKDQTAGNTLLDDSDEFPSRGVWISQLDMISYYYRPTTMRRKIEEDHKQMGIVDWWYGEDDYPIEVAEGVAACHPDAIHIYDEKADQWKPYSEVWKAKLPEA